MTGPSFMSESLACVSYSRIKTTIMQPFAGGMVPMYQYFVLELWLAIPHPLQGKDHIVHV